MAGAILALDIGIRLGYAHGVAGAVPLSGTVLLKQKSEPREIAFSNCLHWLNSRFTDGKPALLVKEAQIPLQAFKHLGNAEHTVKMAMGLHAIIEAVCVRWGVPFENIADSTIRKHFIGKARLGDRASTKAAVVQRCHALKLMPRDSHDDNRADALATWDYAAATFARSSGGNLVLFGEDAA